MKSSPAILFFLACLPMLVQSQSMPSTPEEIMAAAKQRLEMRQNSLLAAYPTRNIGPCIQGGRITDLDVDPRNVHVWYVGYASGGLFKTTNNGQSFEPIFDGHEAMGIGDFCISPADPDLIWLGTGENNSSRSSYSGAGIFKSADAGKTWRSAGLTGSHHIGRILAHPTDPQTAWVASMGPLYTNSPERGIFMTTDGGATWQKTLYINDRTGIIDLVIDPHDPLLLYAAAWERDRKAWEFDEDGPGSGIHKSTDGGKSWKKTKGLPEGETVGRFGLAASPSQKGLLYAVLDNQETDKKLAKEDTIAGLTARKLASMDLESFLKIEDAKLDSFIEGSGYPEKYTSKLIKEDLKAKKYSLQDFNTYFGDANKALFETAVKGSELYRSTDHGESWNKVHSDPLTGVFYTYGYYFGQVRVAPDRPDEIYTYGVPLIKSTDAGKTWVRIDTSGDVHVDHHALWFNPQNANHMLLGNDGGLYASYDRGVHWTHLNNLPVGQFYTVSVDMADPYNVYGGLQDNGVLKGSSRNRSEEVDEWKFIGGGDGMFVVTDPKNSGLYYTGYQFGNYSRYLNGKSTDITPRHDIGQPKNRWNWRTPLIASPHNHEILYMGAQYLFRSMDMGDHWETLSPDLTTNRSPQGNVPYSTITSISESPLKFGLLWVGTDDGKVQLSTDAGNSWNDKSNGLPSGLWVSSLQASPHNKSHAVVSLTGYRNDDFHSYIFSTSDFGVTWQSLRGDLPDEACNIVLQDPKTERLYYVGTDHGSYASLDGGRHWQALSQVPNVAGYDMVVHPRDRELVIGTHGRSIYVVDVKPLQELAAKETGENLFAITANKIRRRASWGTREHPYEDFNLPKVYFRYLLSTNDSKVTVRILDEKGKAIHELSQQGKRGFNSVAWDLKVGSGEKASYVQAGKYKVEFSAGKEVVATDWEVKE